MRDNSIEDLNSNVVVGSEHDGMRHSIRPRRSGTDSEALDSEPLDKNRLFKLMRPVRPTKADTKKQTSEAESKPVKASEPEPKRESPKLPSVIAEPDLPRWHELQKVQSAARLGKGPSLPVVDAERESITVRAFDLLRTRLRQTTKERGWTNIAVCAPTSKCGNTFTAVNLALSLSRISGSRTILMDLNLRKPGVAQALEMRPRSNMTEFLMGHTSIKDHLIRVSDTLALGLNNFANFNAADTLQASSTMRTMERMRAALQPELVIYDIAAMLAYDDVAAFMPNLDAVLLVSDGTQTMARELAECERRLDGQVPLLGVVLNRARNDSIQRYS